MPATNEDAHRQEYLDLLIIFERFLESVPDDLLGWEVLEELMALRSSFMIQHAMRGFGIEYSDALEILRSDNVVLSDYEKARRNVIVAAIDNLVDFAVASEYQMRNEIYDAFQSEDLEIDFDECIESFDKYNDRYARIENLDIEYAMMIAAQIIASANNTVLTYMTQGDERVRPWHLQYEGFSAPKHNFPAWLIPPIEHACRCYLVEDTVMGSIAAVSGSRIATPEMPSWFNKTFKESVALGGRIFSDEHPYFSIESMHMEKLQEISNNIKDRYHNV